MFTFHDIARITGGEIRCEAEDREVKYLITDSRRIFRDNRTVFVAIKGIRHDGHKFIRELIKTGIEQFIIEDDQFEISADFDNCNVLLVQNSIEAVQLIAATYRSQFTIDILGITGSNGKTIVKEWLSQLLSGKFRIARSPKSYNSQLGVPLSVMQLEPYHNFGIFEAGISRPGEMEKLHTVLQPSLGIFTNIGPAHDEGFASRTEKAREKWKLFKNSKKVVYCRDHDEIHRSCPLDASATFTWGSSKDNDLCVSKVQKSKTTTEMEVNFKGQNHHFRIPFSDAASTENAMHCIALCLLKGLLTDDIQVALSGLSRVNMRLELKEGINDCYLIDDSYSNDLSGLEIALDFLNQQPKQGTTVVLSDILQSGLEKKKLYSTVNTLLERKRIQRLIGIGPDLVTYSNLFHLEKHIYPDTDAFIEQFDKDLFRNESILVKGARVFEFEKVVKELTQKAHGTILEINLDAISHNLNYYRSKLQQGTKIMGMVKAFAYGSGSYEVANLLQFHRVDYLGVAYADEGVALRRQGITLPIMVMNADRQVFEMLREYDLEPEVYSMRQLRQLTEHFQDGIQPLKIHVKIDTGMHRLGFEKFELPDLIQHLRTNPQLRVQSIYSHLAGADDGSHDEFTIGQIKKFSDMADHIEKTLGISAIKHILNSPGILRFPTFQFDMVRLGIGLYGYDNTESLKNELLPISTLKTTISQIKKVSKGETVGYGRKGVVDSEKTIATIAIGYADGYSRTFSNGNARVLVKGKLAPVFGNVCMDMTMIDITGIPAKEGDEVILFGAQPTIQELAKSIRTIPYEILTNVSDRVKRVFFTES